MRYLGIAATCLSLLCVPLTVTANILTTCTGYSGPGSCTDSFSWTTTGAPDSSDPPAFISVVRLNDDANPSDTIIDSFDLHVNIAADEKFGIFALEFADGSTLETLAQTISNWSIFEHSASPTGDANTLSGGTSLTEDDSPSGTGEYDFETDSLTAGGNNFNGLQNQGDFPGSDATWDTLFGFSTSGSETSGIKGVRLHFDPSGTFDIADLIGLGVRAQSIGEDDTSFKGYTDASIFTVPEPSPLAFMGVGILGIAIWRRRQQKIDA